MYDQELKSKWDNAAALSQAKLEREAIGQAKGKTEKALEIAQKLRNKNMPIDEIAELTSLSVEEIESNNQVIISSIFIS
ncbi:hypothetical protein [Pedobacter sp. JY14-1]|uniref:hypothetical protein n=1 Tax=Pedobacter sp. JY14-1 TaxID=3034151 RepID=UPI0023E189E1|nr:hypothetical protein [Pedobacter sp. JY14-1]